MTQRSKHHLEVGKRAHLWQHNSNSHSRGLLCKTRSGPLTWRMKVSFAQWLPRTFVDTPTSTGRWQAHRDPLRCFLRRTVPQTTVSRARCSCEDHTRGSQGRHFAPDENVPLFTNSKSYIRIDVVCPRPLISKVWFGSNYDVNGWQCS